MCVWKKKNKPDQTKWEKKVEKNAGFVFTSQPTITPLKIGDLLKEIKFIWNLYDRTRKGWLFNTGDCLIEVTAWAGLTVSTYIFA
jgi:hypothetical protein